MTDPDRQVPSPRRRHRSFAPVVAAGLLGALLAAVAGAQDWARASGATAGIEVNAAARGAEVAPLTTALALVALASWGVVLVTRRQVRRVVAVLGTGASLGALAAVVGAFDEVRDHALQALTGQPAAEDAFVASVTAWYYVAGGAALVTTLTFCVAVWRAPGWPAMGTRYDAPSERAAMPAAEEDMWRALDEGRDPTS